jgi:DNA-binding response OmpR family regulator
LERLVHIDPDLVIVDAASLRTSGKRICQSLRKELDGLPIVLILDKDRETPDHVNADVVLALPFTIQKLVNRVKPLLPAAEKNLLHVGPIRLDLEQRRVRCLGKQSRLTPRLVTLLRILMEHRGEVVQLGAFSALQAQLLQHISFGSVIYKDSFFYFLEKISH